MWQGCKVGRSFQIKIIASISGFYTLQLSLSSQIMLEQSFALISINKRFNFLQELFVKVRGLFYFCWELLQGSSAETLIKMSNYL